MRSSLLCEEPCPQESASAEEWVEILSRSSAAVFERQRGLVASSYLPLLMPPTTPTLNCGASHPCHIIPLTQQYPLGHLAMALGRSIPVDSHLGGYHSTVVILYLMILYLVLYWYSTLRAAGRASLQGCTHAPKRSGSNDPFMRSSSSQLKERSSHLIDYLKTVGYCDLSLSPRLPIAGILALALQDPASTPCQETTGSAWLYKVPQFKNLNAQIGSSTIQCIVTTEGILACLKAPSSRSIF